MNNDPKRISEVKTTYAQLWSAATAAGAYVSYRGLADNGEAGWFEVLRSASRPIPKIVVVRARYLPTPQPAWSLNDGNELTTDVLEDELITLAHEFGHYKSWCNSRPAELEPAQEKFHSGHRLTLEEAKLVYDEEVTAWKLAREQLALQGYIAFETLNQHEAASLGTYHNKLTNQCASWIRS